MLYIMIDVGFLWVVYLTTGVASFTDLFSFVLLFSFSFISSDISLDVSFLFSSMYLLSSFNKIFKKKKLQAVF